MSKIFLKVKIKSLAEEAKIIRHQERQFQREGKGVRWELKTHRKHVVRPEARCAQLAYGFLRGRTYARIESKCHTVPDWRNVERLIVKYGPSGDLSVKKALQDWSRVISPAADVPAVKSSEVDSSSPKTVNTGMARNPVAA